MNRWTHEALVRMAREANTRKPQPGPVPPRPQTRELNMTLGLQRALEAAGVQPSSYHVYAIVYVEGSTPIVVALAELLPLVRHYDEDLAVLLASQAPEPSFADRWITTVRVRSWTGWSAESATPGRIRVVPLPAGGAR